MATQVSPTPISPGTPTRSYTGENGKMSPRKPLPSIPISPSDGRVQGAPLSPVKVNVQRQDWPPSPSRATIEDREGRLRQVRESEEFEAARRHQQSADSQYRPTMDLPYRTDHMAQAPYVQEQSAIISSGDSTNSRGSDGIRSSQETGSGNSTQFDENGEAVEQQPVPRLQYHHQSHSSEGNAGMHIQQRQSPFPSPNNFDSGVSINRHLTPRGTPIQRPYSTYSDLGPKGYSPGTPNPHNRAPSANSGRSYDSRPLSYIDLTNVSYPQTAPAAIQIDNSQLRSAIGTNAELQPVLKTLSMYRENIKKVNDPETQYAFALLLVDCSHQFASLSGAPQPSPGRKSPRTDKGSPNANATPLSAQELLREARQLLQKLSDKGYPFAQYYLADGYASGLFGKNKGGDYTVAFPLFISASKHGHAESGYRAALCYEFGWGTRKDINKAVQFYRQSASKNHPGAMTRLGRACLSGDLGMSKYKEGLKWLNRATESADVQYNAAPYHLGVLYETGWGDDVFKDEIYAAKLFTQAAELGHPEANYRLGDAYEHGKLGCPRDPSLSIHFYTGAAQLGHSVAMMALCAWYMVGAVPVLEKDENEAYEWARQAAELGQYLSPFNLSSY